MNSSAFDYIFKCALGRFAFPEFIVGILQKVPLAPASPAAKNEFSSLAHRAWSLRRMADSTTETSHAFTLPLMLQNRPADYQNSNIEDGINRIQAEIDAIAFDLYGFSAADRQAVAAPLESPGLQSAAEDESQDELEDEDTQPEAHPTASILSWSVGIAFGRFDIRLATGERPMPPEPTPFDPLPAKSPGMLPEGGLPFHPNLGILVDDIGHRHDLPHLIDTVLDRVGVDINFGIRAWLRRDFFPLHIQQYSKSRRKAPIFWPLSTASGSYTLWLYYPTLTDQTLFIAANDFVGMKLDREIEPALRALRQKTGRSREEERELENLQLLHDELRSLRDELLRLAPGWKPHHDDGVQITAAPLWRLFRHRPWQTVLRDTWEKLEAGEHDWAHLAMIYWPARVREKCRTDKSLAIAHDLEHLYEPPPEAPGKVGRGRGKKG